MSRPFPRICASCRERSVQPVVLTSYSTQVDHDGRSYKVTLSDVSGTQCTHCGALILDDAVADRIDDQLREQAGLMSPAEIRKWRQVLGLTQKVLAQKLQIGEATLSRWETGAQIQQRSMDLLLRLCFELPAVQQHLDIAPRQQVSRLGSYSAMRGAAWMQIKPSSVHLGGNHVTWLTQGQARTGEPQPQQISDYEMISKPTKPELKLAS